MNNRESSTLPKGIVSHPKLEIVPLSRAATEVARFLEVAYRIYDGDSFWVAPLLRDLKQVFLDSNPFFQHAEMQLWIARRSGADVGRIAAIIDENHNRTHAGRTAFFGFLETDHEVATSHALFTAAFEWARQRGMTRMIGPMNPTMNDECGLLVDGFDSPPQFMMTYNPSYYESLVRAAGFAAAKNLFAFKIDTADCPRDRLSAMAEKIRQRNPEFGYKPVLRRTLAGDLAKIKEVYNSAWEKNWGHVPMTDAEIDFMAARLKPLLHEGLVWLAERGREPVGFMLAMPDYNEALKPLRGRLCTPRILSLLPYVLRLKLPKRCRVITLGVKEAYRNRGIEAVLLAECIKVGLRLGFKEAEASWILEENLPMHRLLRTFGAKCYKTYRLYERAI